MSFSLHACTGGIGYVMQAASAAAVVGRVKLCVYLLTSLVYVYIRILVGVHWSMFYGSNTCFFFFIRRRPSLLCTYNIYNNMLASLPNSLAVALSSSSPYLLFTTPPHVIIGGLVVDCGDEPHIIRGSGGFSILSRLVWPCGTAPAAVKNLVPYHRSPPTASVVEKFLSRTIVLAR